MSLKTLRLGAALAAVLAAAPMAAHAQNTVKVELGAAGSASRSLSLPKGKSAIVELPVDARDVLVSNPAVADAVLRTPRRIYVLGTAPGQSDAVFFDGAGRQILSLDIRVDAPTGALQDTVARLVPGSEVTVEALGDSMVLSGTVPDNASADKVRRLAERFVEKPEQVVNMLSVTGQDQVTLKVRIIEVQRTVLKQLGVRTNFTELSGVHSYALGRANTFGVNNGLQGGGGGCYAQDSVRATPTPANALASKLTGLSGEACLEAFERVGLVRTLAEPNLTAVSGESAKFLAGGEFPVPVSTDEDGRITVTFKPFGVGLAFTPVVMSEGRISLKVSTEVSELTIAGGFQLADGLSLPALNVRRAETMVELPSGGAMMIAGLLQERAKQNVDSLPGLTNLPVLGALFRSRDFLNDETELVVIVEPYLVKPGRPGDFQTPADGLQIASDLETTLLGRLNKSYRGEAAATPAGAYGAPVGYVID